MGRTNQQLECSGFATKTTASKRLHPEDINVGDFVAILSLRYQYPSYLWSGVDTTRLSPESPVEITYLPSGSIQAYKVQSICLPFVSCKSATGSHQVFDVRQTQLARLSTEFATAVRKADSADVETDACKCKKKRKKKKKKHANK